MNWIAVSDDGDAAVIHVLASSLSDSNDSKRTHSNFKTKTRATIPPPPKDRHKRLIVTLLLLPLLQSFVLQPSSYFFTDAHRLTNPLVSYTTMTGLAFQSNRWKQSMQKELALLAKSAAEASAWQTEANAAESESQALLEKAREEQSHSKSLQEQAESLEVKGEEDENEANLAKKEAEGMFVEAAQSREDSAALLAQAAVQESALEEDLTKATADAALAVRSAGGAEADEAGTVFCQWIPFVDVVCDVVGGIAAVGLETQAAREASLVTEEYAAAAALQAKVESWTQEGGELEASAVEEEKEAGVLRDHAAELEALAQEELAEGRAEEGAAREELAQSMVDEEAGREKETMALTEEEESVHAWSQMAQHGAKACEKAIMMCVVSVAAVLFWTMKMGGKVLRNVVPYCWLTVQKFKIQRVRSSGISSSVSSTMIGSPDRSRIIALSHVVHHALLLVLFFGMWGNQLLQLRRLTSVTAMGGVIVGFSFCVATTQILFWHCVPKAYCNYFMNGVTLGSTVWFGVHDFVRFMLVLLPLVIMEILLAWVNCGGWLFATDVVQAVAHKWWLWGILLTVGTVSHYRYFICKFGESATVQQEYHDCNQDDPSELSLLGPITHGGHEHYDSVAENDSYAQRSIVAKAEFLRTEDDFMDNDSALPPKLQDIDNANISAKAQPISNLQYDINVANFVTLVKNDASRIQLVLVFEILMASIMLALLHQSIHVVRQLWPASKEIVLDTLPHWHLLMAAAMLVAAALSFSCACF